LGTVESLPTKEEINLFVENSFEAKAVLSSDDEENVHMKAKEFLNEEQVENAWKLLLAKRV
jgi:hypothetical protein